MIFNLLCLIVLASVAHKSKKVVLCGVAFGLVKGIGNYLVQIDTATGTQNEIIVMSLFQLAANALLGIGVAYFVANHNKLNAALVSIGTLVCAVLTFLTDWMIDIIIA